MSLTNTASTSRRAALEARLRAAGDQPDRIPPHPGPPDRPPLSYAQERFWFLEQIHPGTVAFQLPWAVRIRGSFDPDAMVTALRAAYARHDALRTVFAENDGVATGRIAPAEPFVVAKVDLTGDAPERRARAWLRDMFTTPLSLTDGPLLRTAVLTLADDDHVIALCVHHAVCDGWSIELLMRDVWNAYRTIANGGSYEPPAIPVRYADAAAWQRSRVEGNEGAFGLEYWREQLAGVPPLELPTDRPRPAELEFAGRAYTFRSDAVATAAIERLARELRATPFMVLLAGVQAALGLWSGQDDFAVGTPFAGRNHPDVEPVVGMFVNTVALRADLSGQPDFAELVRRAARATLGGLQHEHIPFERVVAELTGPRDLGRTPVYQVTFALQSYQRAGDAAPQELTITGFPADNDAAHGDLSIYVDREPAGYLWTVTYRSALFDEATIATFAARLTRLLDAVTADPSAGLSHALVMSDVERDRELARAVGPPLAEPPNHTLPGLVQDAAIRTPGVAAVVCAGQTLTYRELDDAAARWARRLCAAGVAPGDRVGLLLPQSVDLAAAVLGVMKAGAAYVPLDPEQPAERLSLMATDAGLAALVSTSDLVGSAAWAPDTVLLVDGGLEHDDADRGLPEPAPDRVAYVIYTSGSTGQPKGVAVAHQQAVRYVAGVAQRLGIRAGGRHLLMQSLSFDFGLTLLYTCLTSSGTLHLLPPRTSGHDVAAYLRLHRIDYLKLTPSHFNALAADTGPEALLPNEILIFGGETSSWSLTRDLAALGGPHGRTRVVNHYGPTEATVGIATYEVDPAVPPSAVTTPIGVPLPGARVYLLDDSRHPVPPGTVGELYLGGDRLARGYLGKPELTAQLFLTDPYGPPGARMYRSGDLGRRLPDGSLEFLGRRDQQVKIRGYRVEPGEVEAALCALPGIRQCVVDVRRQLGEPALVAYLVPTESAQSGDPPPETALRESLQATLPDYMVPSRFVWLAELPLARHGKVNRAALPEPPERVGAHEYVAPTGPLETVIAEVWREILELPRVGSDDDFFDLGGHSLLAVRVVARLRKRLPEGGRPVSIMDIFAAPTVGQLAGLAQRPPDAGRGLLHRLNPAQPTTTASIVCAPYGGGSALIYKPLADAIDPQWALYSIAVPGYEAGETARPMPEVAAACAAQILAEVAGPLVLYGHCGPGVMLIVELARRLEAAGRPVEAVYLGGSFPFARPGGRGRRLRDRWRDLRDRLRSDRWAINTLAASGLDVSDVDPDQIKLIVTNQRDGSRDAEAYFGELFTTPSIPLAAPIISVVGQRDPATDFYEERFREWHALSGTTAVVVLDEAGHFFLKYRSHELAELMTGVHIGLAQQAPSVPVRDAATARADGSTWWLQDVSRRTEPEQAYPAREPGLGRFAAVLAGQGVSVIGAALSEFALPLWIFMNTGSVGQFALFAVLALIPGVLVSPLAGAIVDRYSRRVVMLAGDVAAGGAQAVLATLYLTGTMRSWHIYTLLTVLSIGLTFQRLAYGSAIAQLVPKRFLGHANGLVQLSVGVAQFLVPLLALGVLATVGLGGILVFDVASYLFAIAITAAVRFPNALPWRRRESLITEIKEGFRFSGGHRGFRSMLLYMALINVSLSPLLTLVGPLVLSFAPLPAAALVAMCSGAGFAVGGLAMGIWGGPRHRRMRGVLWCTVGLAAAGALTGAVASVPVIAAGAFGMTLSLALLNGVYATIVLVKVPQRYHGRVFGLNQMIALSTIPVATGLVAPALAGALTAAIAPGGVLARGVGAWFGAGPGRGIGLTIVLFAVALAVTTALLARMRGIAEFDNVVPDAEVDDLVGISALGDRFDHSGTRP